LLSKSRARQFSFQILKADSLKKQILSSSTKLIPNFLNDQLEKAQVLQNLKPITLSKVSDIEPKNSFGIGFSQEFLMEKNEQFHFLRIDDPRKNPSLKKMLMRSIQSRLINAKLKQCEICRNSDAIALFDSNDRLDLIPFDSICRNKVFSKEQRLFGTFLEQYSLKFLKKVMHKEIDQKCLKTQNDLYNSSTKILLKEDIFKEN